MLDLLIVVAGSAVLLGGMVGYFFGKFKQKRIYNRSVVMLSTDQNEKEELERYKGYVNGYREKLQALDKKAEDYKKIASSHEVTYPKENDVRIETRQVWKKRKYYADPSSNLVMLKDDLEKAMGDDEGEVVFAIDPSTIGGAPWRDKTDSRWFDGKVKSNFEICYEGTAKWIMQQITAILRDESNGLSYKWVDTLGYRVEEWVEKEAPLRFTVDLTVKHVTGNKKLPEVHTVEVLRLEEKIVEVEKIVEKVMRSDD